MKSRRRIAPPAKDGGYRNGLNQHAGRGADCRNVRFGSEADMCAAKGVVRFTPESDREIGLRQLTMSALPPTADMCGANRTVSFGPIADINGPNRLFHRRGRAATKAR